MECIGWVFYLNYNRLVPTYCVDLSKCINRSVVFDVWYVANRLAVALYVAVHIATFDASYASYASYVGTLLAYIKVIRIGVCANALSLGAFKVSADFLLLWCGHDAYYMDYDKP